ncbi:hypothetical protein BJ508DRAFT_58143 [Ascobolus immersus RN42]|uniref:Uncharacterized protein n=1 Tax=Ascobolus immersus RN42 TaxID=1160509 RepID=A0A3N4HLQ7_ASCIM|nr:hypothetical protein BJ508DRAFT_58143 [Ascobolus immersus RN42]
MSAPTTPKDEFDDLLNTSDDELEYLMASLQDDPPDIGTTSDEILLSDGIDALDDPALAAYLDEFDQEMLDEADLTASTFADSTDFSTPGGRGGGSPNTPATSPTAPKEPTRQHPVQNNVRYPPPRVEQGPPGTTMAAATTPMKDISVANTILPSPGTVRAMQAANHDSPIVSRMQRRPMAPVAPNRYRYGTPFKPHQRASPVAMNKEDAGLAGKIAMIRSGEGQGGQHGSERQDGPSPGKRQRLDEGEQRERQEAGYAVPPDRSRTVQAPPSPAKGYPTSNGPQPPPGPLSTIPGNATKGQAPLAAVRAEEARKLMPPPPSPARMAAPAAPMRPTRSNHPPLAQDPSLARPMAHNQRPPQQAPQQLQQAPIPAQQAAPKPPPEIKPENPPIKPEEPPIKPEPSTPAFPKMSSQEARFVKREIDAEAAEREIHYRTSYLSHLHPNSAPNRPVRASTMIYNQMRKRDEDARKRMEEWRAAQAEKELEELIGTPTMEDRGVWICRLDTERWEVLYGGNSGTRGDWSGDDVVEVGGVVVPK